MKLLRVLIIFLAITLFAGCEVWISFWGDADGDRNIYVRADASTAGVVGGSDAVMAALYRKDGSSFTPVGKISAIDGAVRLNGAFLGVPSAEYKVSVWIDEDGDDAPDFKGVPGTPENGVTSSIIDMRGFIDYTIVIDSAADWVADGDVLVTLP